MIPMPGLEILFWMLQVTIGLTVVMVLLCATLVIRARRRWRASRPARWEHRLAFGAVVWAAIWVVLNLPERIALLALLPLALSVGGFRYIAAGNRRRGHENPRLRTSGLAAAALAVLTLVAVGYIAQARAEARKREEAERRAEGQRNQDSFQAVARADDSTIVTFGTTSTPPNDADDLWMCAFDLEGRLLDSHTFARPGDQAGLALAIGRNGERIFGGRDDEHPFIAWATRDSVRREQRWDSLGAVSALLPTRDGALLVGGQMADSAWVGLLDPAGRESWRSMLATRVQYPQVDALAISGRRFVAAGSDRIFSQGAFLAAGTLDGGIEWVRTFESESSAVCALSDVCIQSDGTILALGRRGSRDSLGDLWLVHTSRDGRTLSESTLGESSGESPGGLAMRGTELIVVGNRFAGLSDRLVLRSGLESRGV